MGIISAYFVVSAGAFIVIAAGAFILIDEGGHGRNEAAVDGDCAAAHTTVFAAAAADSGIPDSSVFRGDGRGQSAHGIRLVGLAVDGEAVVLLHLDAAVDGEGAAVRQDQVHVAGDGDALVDGHIAAGHIPAAGGAAVPGDRGFVNGSAGIDGFCLFRHHAAVPAPLNVPNRVLRRQGGGGQQRQAQGQNAEQAEHPLFHRPPPLQTRGHPNLPAVDPASAISVYLERIFPLLYMTFFKNTNVFLAWKPMDESRIDGKSPVRHKTELGTLCDMDACQRLKRNTDRAGNCPARSGQPDRDRER